MKNALILVSIIALLLVLGATYFGARGINKERIAQLEKDLVVVQARRDSIQTVVAYKDSLQNLIRGQVDIMMQEANRLRDDVARLEAERQEQELDVRRLDSFEAVEAKFLETFPDLNNRAEIVLVPLPGLPRPLKYIRMPLAVTETFVIDHQDALSYRAQRDTLLALDLLQTEVIALKDSLIVLEEEKSAAYKFGYDDAFSRYEALNQEYIGVLRRPPSVSLFPNKTTAFVSGALGVVVGVAASSVINND